MRSRMTVVLCAALLAFTAACSGGGSDPEPDAPDPTQGSSEKIVEISALTGLELAEGRPSNPVFVVKIENTAGGAPQHGLDQADLVVEELVEGGLTRLAAFYYSTLPSKVGHVRSMRSSDIGIAAPVGGQIVASGGAGGTYKKVEKAGIEVFSEDHGAPGFSSDPAKSRPYNRLIDLKALNKKATASAIPGPYFPWTPAKKDDAAQTPAAPAAGATTATTAAVRFSNSTRTQWALKDSTWQRTNGFAAAGKDFKADTLVVVFAKVGSAGYRDPAGNPVPETKFEGSGRAVILHGDQVVETTWKKESLSSTLSFATADGAPVTINPGKVWIELVPADGGGFASQ